MGSKDLPKFYEMIVETCKQIRNWSLLLLLQDEIRTMFGYEHQQNISETAFERVGMV